ncbi:hypothetical protein [Parasedimentitalea psychrophila]|uniref:Apolipoprotein acyltransferase n=1 Tax=Parasedimentitalea psychrophila TaxID=2997337 RepID=A0A9Y2KWR0_9RHOB|nr:hypothetical protein [Parasedimentitalea psychrophila]WIY24088.1 hypothetical protein QPJ95_15865 [Parasedimentitalea psychrophila]
MIVIGGLVIGALLGGYKARKRGGGLGDILQYAAAYGIILGLAGMLLTLMVHRLAV